MFIKSIIDWIHFFICLYIHIISTIKAAIYIAKYDYPVRPQRSCKKMPVIISRRRRLVRNNKIKSLPTEILLLIFNQLDQKDLYHCLTVSKQWKKIITPLLWKVATPLRPILNCGQKFPSIYFPIHFQQYGHSIQSLDLSLIAHHVNDSTIRQIIYYCPNITKLNLTNCRAITDESFRLLARAPLAHNLESLVLTNCRQITDRSLYYLSTVCDQLELLHLNGCVHIGHSGVTRLMTITGKSIRHLRINDCPLLTSATIQVVGRYCGPKLESIDLSRLPFKHTDIVKLVKQCPNITQLDMSLKNPIRSDLMSRSAAATVSDPDRHIHELSGFIELLNQLNIHPTLSAESARHRRFILEQQRVRDLVCDRTIEYVSIHLKNLKRLDLSHWACLTDSGVRALADNCRHLSEISLLGCTSVTKRGYKYLAEAYCINNNNNQRCSSLSDHESLASTVVEVERSNSTPLPTTKTTF